MIPGGMGHATIAAAVITGMMEYMEKRIILITIAHFGFNFKN